MSKPLIRLASRSLLFLLFLFFNGLVFAEPIKGIYLMQSTVENTQLFNELIEKAKSVGINTFVVDMDKPGKLFQKNVKLLAENNIRYVARVVMFPDGATPDQIQSEEFWKRKYKLVNAAVNYGADEIQLDYIRYNSHSGSSKERSKNVYKIIQWYKNQLAEKNIPLQIDVFGISSYGEEPHIGQNIPLFAQTVDALCPMVYPSHYTPFKQHADTPYKTVYDSLVAIQDQFDEKMPVKLIPYIELSNYHYLLSRSKKVAYIRAQIKAVYDAKADGWYAWSPHNEYGVLFEVLRGDS